MSCGPSFTIKLLAPRYWLTGLAVVLFAPVAWLPVTIRHQIGRWLGGVVYRRNNKRRAIVLQNLAVALPGLSAQQREEKALKMLQWYGCAMIDYSVLFFRSKRYLQKQMKFEGLDKVESVVSEGQPVVILLAHSVWLDFAPAALSASFDLYGSYKPLSNALLDWLLQRMRCRYVKFVIAREEGMLRLVRSLKDGRVLVFLPDEDLGVEQADFAPFFGRKKATLKTPARIAAIKKASCFPCYTYFNNDTQQYCTVLGEVLAPFPAKASTDSAIVLNNALEQVIRSDIEQYMWQLKYYRSTDLGDEAIYTH
ncbi:MAG TPA: lipid A biosynthesis acyltransferase [Thiotrichaceae bacterium]|nr:lipid A biosynthesis acyltransferase [Thiotrichaceae bacterium]